MTVRKMLGPSPVGGGPLPALTPDELLVLTRAAAGHTYAAMADDLGSETLRKIVSRMFEKLGAVSMPHAVYLACVSGVLAVDAPRPKGVEVLAQPSLRLLRSLMAEGFSLVFIAGRMGMGQPELSVLMQRKHLTPEMAARVRRVFADLAGRDPLELGVHPRGRTRALNRARAEGWEIVPADEVAGLRRTVAHAA